MPNPNLDDFKKEVANLRSLGLLGSKLTSLAVSEARLQLKEMSEDEIGKARHEIDVKIQADEDYWDKVDDDEIWKDR